MMAEADDTATKVCKALQDEHDKRAKYFKQGKVQKYALGDTVWVEWHNKDVLSRHRQASWYVPGVIVRKVGQDVYAVRVGDNKILDRDQPVRTPVAILGSLGVCIYVPASRHWLISYFPIHLT